MRQRKPEQHSNQAQLTGEFMVFPTVNKLRIGIKRRLGELNADKRYDSRAFRRNLLKHGTTSNIPERQRKSHRRQHGPHAHMDKDQFKFRTFVERAIAWLKGN
ncbi:hypothetical protein Krac_0186 [Ktedonobacter racemifer DSM 44963]|uniref:Uncharacterized protein n=1 Tax=Ktedonobacter racemifer DSM 44963 TaxID=485913 RepID=D6U738_KTERA|nr:hypothetical protein Krac_0186 [Ktedonobacter racemifer DSM 44963]